MGALWVIIDVGIVNLGLVALRVINRDEWTVVHMERVDITKLPPFLGEKHRRSREIADRMERFFYRKTTTNGPRSRGATHICAL